MAGFSKGFKSIMSRLGDERPLAFAELCAFAGEKRSEPESTEECRQILKRRRCLFKQRPQERNGYGKSIVDWQHVFKKLNSKIPGVGNVVIPPEDDIVPVIQQLIPEMKVHHVEACRGVDRLRTPFGQYDQSLVSSRKTVVINRNTGVVEDEDPVEKWVSLPRYKQIRKGRPAKIAITVFGAQTNSDGSQQNPLVPTQEIEQPDENMLGDMPVESSPSDRPPDNRHNPDKVAWGPPPVAKWPRVPKAHESGTKRA